MRKLLPPAAVLVDGYTDVGFEFRPAKDGSYFIETLYLQDQSFRYNVRVAPDCRADKTTRCTLKPGVTQQRITAWAYDTDWFKAQLTRGKTYAVGIESSSGTVEIVNGDGAVLAVGSQKFTPSSTGAYFVRVRTGNDTGETYRVMLSLD